MRTRLYFAPLAMRAALQTAPLFAAMRKLRPAAANDNNPNNKTTRMVAYNGGCSTTSGMVPVSVQRLSFLDGARVAA